MVLIIFLINAGWAISFTEIITRISVSGMLFVHWEYILQAGHCFCFFSSSVVHVPGVNDIQSSSSTGQNLTQISRQLNQSQVAWTGNRPPFPGQVLIKAVLFSRSLEICNPSSFYKGITNSIYTVIKCTVFGSQREICSSTSVPWQVIIIWDSSPMSNCI